MNPIQQGLVALIKSAILSAPQSLPEDFSLSEAMPLIRSHHMAAMIFDGAARCGIPRTAPEMQTLFRTYCKSLQHSEGQLRQLGRIFAAFRQAGVDFLPLKGCNMKHLYPKPELRSMGDADILIRMEQYALIRPLLLELGFTEGSETDHELHWEHPQLHLELHKHLIPSYNHDFYARFGTGWQLAHVQEGSRYAMDPEDEFLFLFTHFTKHYRDGGIGCRYVADLWVWLRTCPAMDWQRLERSLEELELLEFWRNIHALIAWWFEDGPENEKLNFIADYIFASGSWGDEIANALSQAVRDSEQIAFGLNGKSAYFLRNMFPSVSMLEGQYRLLKRAPWMLPAVWVVRPFYKLLFDRQSLIRQKKRMDALADKNVEDHRKALQYVGLETHF